MGPLLKTIQLKKYFKIRKGILHAVDDINIEINNGKTLGVVGESGCGKSTLGRLVLRLIEPTSGKIFFEGIDITQYSKQKMKLLRRHMQMVFQDPYSSLDPRKSVFDLIAEPIVVNRHCEYNHDMERVIYKLMDTVGLPKTCASLYPHELDGGRRQRIGIARALALEPKFIVCDEPVSALDVSIRAQILNLLMDLQEEKGLTYMFITHDLSVVKHISDEIVVMYLGRCVERAKPKELFKNPLHPYTKALLAAIPLPRLLPSRKKYIIRGEIADPINPKPGCRFAPRCDYHKDICWEADVELKDQGEGHQVACNLYQ